MSVARIIDSYADNEEAKKFLRLADYTNNNIFLTGKAGTGKSYLLTKFTQHTNKNYVILAPTGIAAINVGGQTIHSFFQLPLSPLLPNDDSVRSLTAQYELIRKLDTIIIDEISMVRCDVMNAIDLALRKTLGIDAPFGRKQIISIGDLFQLPPVIDDQQIKRILQHNYRSHYFYGATAFNYGFNFNFIELKKVYRQTEQNFINLLDKVRTNSLTPEDFSLLNTRISSPAIINSNNSIILLTTNKAVDTINDNELNKLSGTAKTYRASKTGTFLAARKQKPAPDILTLKVGAKVMLIKNDREKRWVNGDIGKVTRTDINTVFVKIDRDGQEYEITVVKWEENNYFWNPNTNQVEKNVIGTYEQLPIKLAWAITIHKSQGQTFSNVMIDFGQGAFATGQAYVALTRCRTFAGLTLYNKIISTDIKVDKEIVNFFDRLRENDMNKENNEELLRGLEKKLVILEDLNETLKQRIKNLEADCQKHTDELRLLRKKNASNKKWIKILVLLVIVISVALLIFTL